MEREKAHAKRTSDCIGAAKNDLANARRYLESGEAVNWVADNIGSALNWAMEGLADCERSSNQSWQRMGEHA